MNDYPTPCRKPAPEGTGISLAHHARTLVIKRPVRDQILHAHRVIARAQAVFLVQLMSFHYPIHIELHAQTRFRRYLYHPAFNFKGLFGQTLVTLLPDPVGVDGGNFTRRCRRHVGKHRQRDIKVVVRVRACMVQKCGSASGISTDCSDSVWPI